MLAIPIPFRAALALVVVATLGVPPNRVAAQKGASATEPVSRYEAGSRFGKRHEDLVALAKKGGIDVLFLGDSITEQWGQQGKAVWQKHFEPLRAANFGISADRTQNVLWRIHNGELEGVSPKVVVLLIGTNNPNKAPDTAAGITAIVKCLRDKLPASKVLLLGVFPRGGGPEAGTRYKELNGIIAKLDDGKMVRFLDIGDRFLQDGSIPKELMPDRFLHLSEKGYQVWADAMLVLLQEMLGMKQEK